MGQTAKTGDLLNDSEIQRFNDSEIRRLPESGVHLFPRPGEDSQRGGSVPSSGGVSGRVFGSEETG